MKRALLLSLLLLLIKVNLYSQTFKERLEFAINIYAKQKCFYKNFKYSDLSIDSLSLKDFYIFSFLPSNNKLVLSEDPVLFPNCLIYIKFHPIIWYDNTKGIDSLLIKDFDKMGLIDSFYINLKKNDSLSDIIDDPNIPKMIIDERKQSFDIAINKGNPYILFTIKSNNTEAIKLKILRKEDKK